MKLPESVEELNLGEGSKSGSHSIKGGEETKKRPTIEQIETEFSTDYEDGNGNKKESGKEMSSQAQEGEEEHGLEPLVCF